MVDHVPAIQRLYQNLPMLFGTFPYVLIRAAHSAVYGVGKGSKCVAMITTARANPFVLRRATASLRFGLRYVVIEFGFDMSYVAPK